MSTPRAADPTSGLSRCPECGDVLRCGARRGEPTCWCNELPPLAPDPSLPPDACLCERCLRRRLADQGR